MKNISMQMKLGCAVAALVGLGAFVGCAGDKHDGPVTVKGEELSPSAERQIGRDGVSIPEGARVISDVAANRFIVALSDEGSSYVLGRTLSCSGATPVRTGSQIACLTTSPAAARAPEVGYVYLALEQPASALRDADLATAPAVTMTTAAGHGSVRCGAPSADLASMRDRFVRDVSAEIARSGGKTFPVLASYNGSWLKTRVPAGLIYGVNTFALEELVVDDESGVTCSCVSGGTSCPKGSKLIATYCDASNCQSCSMSW